MGSPRLLHPTEPDWLLRVREEAIDLRKKIHRLEGFLGDSARSSPPALDVYHRALLENQLRAMQMYHWILTERIACRA